MLYLEGFIACFKIMHKIETKKINLDKHIVFRYEKALIVLIIIATCGCRPQVVRTVTMDVIFIVLNDRNLLRIMENMFFLLDTKRPFV